MSYERSLDIIPDLNVLFTFNDGTEYSITDKDLKLKIKTVIRGMKADRPVDHHQPFPNKFELACASERAYEEHPLLQQGAGDDKISLEYLKPNWKFLFSAKNYQNKYFGCALVHKLDRQILIAHRGTASTEALQADINAIMGNDVTSHVNSACLFVLYLTNILNEMNSEPVTLNPVQISITGHSLGGWLAQITTFAAKCLELCSINGKIRYKTYAKDKIGWHVHCEAFDSPGAKQILQKLNWLTNEASYKENLTKNLDITVNLGPPNLINIVNEQVGEIFEVDLGSQIKISERKILPILENVSLLEESFEVHKIKNFVRALSNGCTIRKITQWPVMIYENWSTRKVHSYHESWYKALYKFIWQFEALQVSKELKNFVKTNICDRDPQTEDYDMNSISLNVFSDQAWPLLCDIREYICLRSHVRDTTKTNIIEDKNFNLLIKNIKILNIERRRMLVVENSGNECIRLINYFSRNPISKLREILKNPINVSQIILITQSHSYERKLYDQYVNIFGDIPEFSTLLRDILSGNPTNITNFSSTFSFQSNCRETDDFIRLKVIRSLKIVWALEGGKYKDSFLISNFEEIKGLGQNVTLNYENIQLLVVDCLQTATSISQIKTFFEKSFKKYFDKYGEEPKTHIVFLINSSENAKTLEFNLVSENEFRKKLLGREIIFQGRICLVDEIFQLMDTEKFATLFASDISTAFKLINKTARAEIGFKPPSFFEMDSTYATVPESKALDFEDFYQLFLSLHDTIFVLEIENVQKFTVQNNSFQNQYKEMIEKGKLKFINSKEEQNCRIEFQNLCKQFPKNYLYLFEYSYEGFSCKLCYNPKMYSSRQCEQLVIINSELDELRKTLLWALELNEEQLTEELISILEANKCTKIYDKINDNKADNLESSKKHKIVQLVLKSKMPFYSVEEFILEIKELVQLKRIKNKSNRLLNFLEIKIVSDTSILKSEFEILCSDSKIIQEDSEILNSHLKTLKSNIQSLKSNFGFLTQSEALQTISEILSSHSELLIVEQTLLKTGKDDSHFERLKSVATAFKFFSKNFKSEDKFFKSNSAFFNSHSSFLEDHCKILRSEVFKDFEALAADAIKLDSGWKALSSGFNLIKSTSNFIKLNSEILKADSLILKSHSEILNSHSKFVTSKSQPTESHSAEGFQSNSERLLTHSIKLNLYSEHTLSDSEIYSYNFENINSDTVTGFKNILKAHEQRLKEHSEIIRSHSAFLNKESEIWRTDSEIWESQERLIIIADDPGMGKTTTLTKIAEDYLETDPSCWVLRSDLREIKSIEKPNDDNWSNIIKALHFDLSNLNKSHYDFQLTSKTFLYTLNHNSKKMCFCFDGFDEIVDKDLKTYFTELLKFLKNKTEARIVVTTRLQQDFAILEQALCVPSYSFIQIKYTAQFLSNFWHAITRLIPKPCKKFEKAKVNEFADQLISSAGKYLKNENLDFLGIPLQLRMLSEVYLQVVIKFHETGNSETLTVGEYSLLKIFQQFTERKYEIFFRHKLKVSKNQDLITQLTQRKLEEIFELLSIQVLKHTDSQKELLINSNSTDTIPASVQDLLLTGIIVNSFNTEVEFDFIHRTFAEFYFSQLIYNQIIALAYSPQNQFTQEWKLQFWKCLISKCLHTSRHWVVRLFLNERIKEKIRLEESLINKVEINFNEQVAKLQLSLENTILKLQEKLTSEVQKIQEIAFLNKLKQNDSSEVWLLNHFQVTGLKYQQIQENHLINKLKSNYKIEKLLITLHENKFNKNFKTVEMDSTNTLTQLTEEYQTEKENVKNRELLTRLINKLKIQRQICLDKKNAQCETLRNYLTTIQNPPDLNLVEIINILNVEESNEIKNLEAITLCHEEKLKELTEILLFGSFPLISITTLEKWLKRRNYFIEDCNLLTQNESVNSVKVYQRYCSLLEENESGPPRGSKFIQNFWKTACRYYNSKLSDEYSEYTEMRRYMRNRDETWGKYMDSATESSDEDEFMKYTGEFLLTRREYSGKLGRRSYFSIIVSLISFPGIQKEIIRYLTARFNSADYTPEQFPIRRVGSEQDAEEVAEEYIRLFSDASGIREGDKEADLWCEFRKIHQHFGDKKLRGNDLDNLLTSFPLTAEIIERFTSSDSICFKGIDDEIKPKIAFNYIMKYGVITERNEYSLRRELMLLLREDWLG